MEKDYSLLRPFDPEAAKRGEAICWAWAATAPEYVCGPDHCGRVVCKSSEYGYFIDSIRNLRMHPLTWVEGKPVYKGDVLYMIGGTTPHTVIGGTGVLTLQMVDGSIFLPEDLTWTKPKRKVEKFLVLRPAMAQLFDSEKQAKDFLEQDVVKPDQYVIAECAWWA